MSKFLIKHSYLIPLFFLVVTGIFIYAGAQQRSDKQQQIDAVLKEIGKDNNSLNRAMLCIASVSPPRRTPEYVKKCYADAEQVNGITIDRYGDAK